MTNVTFLYSDGTRRTYDVDRDAPSVDWVPDGNDHVLFIVHPDSGARIKRIKEQQTLDDFPNLDLRLVGVWRIFEISVTVEHTDEDVEYFFRVDEAHAFERWIKRIKRKPDPYALYLMSRADLPILRVVSTDTLESIHDYIEDAKLDIGGRRVLSSDYIHFRMFYAVWVRVIITQAQAKSKSYELPVVSHFKISQWIGSVEGYIPYPMYSIQYRKVSFDLVRVKGDDTLDQLKRQDEVKTKKMPTFIIRQTRSQGTK